MIGIMLVNRHPRSAGPVGLYLGKFGHVTLTGEGIVAWTSHKHVRTVAWKWEGGEFDGCYTVEVEPGEERPFYIDVQLTGR